MNIRFGPILTLICVLASSAGLAQTPALITTFTNPTPANYEYFGEALAAVGNDRVLISAPNDSTGAAGSGIAYLFNTNGALLMTFPNPTPGFNEAFGASLGALGSDRVLIGAPYYASGAAAQVGSAYLFSTAGILLTTFTNPTPANGDQFGFSVAGVGNDRALVGAYRDNTGAAMAGAAYLFTTNGALLTTFTNPAPTNGGYFGWSVAALGSAHVLIGAYGNSIGAGHAGAVYLFSTNGLLLIAFTNPTPQVADWFGYAVAAVGSDRVLISAPNDDTGGTDTGAAYLYSTNGTLLSTFPKPMPAGFENFGISVTAVGSDRVLIGAYQDNTGATHTGAAYLFNTNGALLMTITNPTPQASDFFGFAVAAAGSERVFISAYLDNTGALGTGAAYLFGIPPPVPSLLAVLSPTNTVIVSWPSPSTGFALQQNTNLARTNWVAPMESTSDDGTNKLIVISPPAGNRFFRLQKP